MSGTVSLCLLCTGFAVFMAGVALNLLVDHKLRVHGDLFSSLGYGLMAVANVLGESPWLTAWNAGWAAYYFWRWWNGDGGDGMRRRLKRWRESFSSGLKPAMGAA